MVQVKEKKVQRGFVETHAKKIVLVIGWLYILAQPSLMYTLIVQKDWYYGLFTYMPLWLVNARYSFSWFQRIFCIVIGVGLIHFKEIYRKITIWFCVFVMATLYWRHPYSAFLEHTRILDRKYGYLLKTPPEMNFKITFELLTIPSIIAQCLVDIAFCSMIIYLLTREPVKKLFTK